MILVDSSVWVDHLYSEIPQLSELLSANDVLMHPFVLGEIACGHIHNRVVIMESLWSLPFSAIATTKETIDFIERYSLMARGAGFVDINLLASAAVTGGARFWTRDKPLRTMAEQLDLAYAASQR